VHRNRTILWALLLIGVGVYLLLQTAEIIPEDVEVWPLLLIGIGVWLLLERRLFGSRWGGGYVWPILLIAVGGVLFLQDVDALPQQDVFLPVVIIAIGLGLALSAISQSRSGSAEAEPEPVSVPLEGAREARLRLEHGAGVFRVRAGGGSALVEGTCAGGVDTQVERTGDRLDVRIKGRPGMPWAAGRDRGFEWDLAVARHVPIALELRTGASEADYDLTDLDLTDLQIHSGASKTTARLPAEGRYTVRVSGGAMNAVLHVPEGVAARIEGKGGLSDVKVDERRFPRWGGEWRSADYDTAEHRADIRLDIGMAGVEVR
jgi:hypothetical protein